MRLPRVVGVDILGGGPVRIAIPKRGDRAFFGNEDAARLFADGLQALASSGNELIEIDFGVFAETSMMMFDGPWLAERYAMVGDFIREHPNSVDPSVRQVILSAADYSAADAFKAIYRLHRNVREIRRTFDTADIIAVPTVGTVYRVSEVQADPFATNSTNGLYTNFVSMADLAALAVPNGVLPSGVPMGMTFVGPAFSDGFLAAFGERFHRLRAATLGATGHPHPELVSLVN